MSVSLCCTKPLLTPYCPYCGKHNDDPILELVDWLRKKSKEAGQQASTRESRGYIDSKTSASGYRKRESQYAAWADLVLERAGK